MGFAAFRVWCSGLSGVGVRFSGLSFRPWNRHDRDLRMALISDITVAERVADIDTISCASPVHL